MTRPICYECGKTNVSGVFVGYETLPEAFICWDHHPSVGDEAGCDRAYYSPEAGPTGVTSLTVGDG